MNRSIVAFLVLFIQLTVYAAEPTSKLPSGANAALSLDVQTILASEFAKTENWRNTMQSNPYDRPLAIPASARRVTTAAFIDLAAMEPRWQASLIDTPLPLNTAALAAARRGYVDRMGDKHVVVTPGGTSFAQHSPGTIAAFWPAQRQLIMRWMSGKGQPAGLPPGISDALKSDAPLVLVIDTSDAYSTAGIFNAIHEGDFPSLDRYEGDIATLADALASVTQIELTARFTSRIRGEVSISFRNDLAPIGPYAKSLVLDAVAEAGLDPKLFADWNFSVQDQQIKGTGEIKPEMLEYINTRFSPPAPPEEVTTSPTEAAAINAERAAAKASAQYYKSLTQVIDRINFNQASLKQTGQYLRSQALLLQRFPVLHVDPALQDWGGRLAEAFNRSAQVCINGQNQAIASVHAIASPVSYNTDGTAYSTTANAETRAAFRNAQSQRREAGAGQRVVTLDATMAIINEAIAPRTQLRKEMSQKYNVEF